MTNSTKSSENLDLKIKEALAALEEYRDDLNVMYANQNIDMDSYKSILDEMGHIVAVLIMDMRIAHDYRGHTDVLPHGSLHES